MTIQVRCPNGCQLSLPARQKGKVVQCQHCAATIRIPRKATGTASDSVINASLLAEAGELELETLRSDSAHLPPTDNSASESDQQLLEFLGNRSLDESEVSELLPIELANQPREDGLVAIEHDEQQKPNAARDRVWLVRFYGVCLFVLSLANLVPLLIFAIYFRDQIGNQVLPRWAFATLFLAIIFAAYSIYLAQIPDWSTLTAATVFVLVVSCVYGFCVAGLMFGGMNSQVARWLQIPQAYFRMAPIWCGIMFCLLALVSFVFGKDAWAWQRSDSIRRSMS